MLAKARSANFGKEKSFITVSNFIESCSWQSVS
jgi:hypothetical protein